MTETKSIEVISKNYIEMANEAVLKYLTNSSDIAEVNSESVKKLMIIILSSKEYIDAVKINVKKIKEDGKIDASDIPFIMNIIVRSIKQLNDIIIANKKIIINTITMKYIIYGILKYVIYSENVEMKDKDIDSYFESAWTLITFNLDAVVAKFKSCFSCCCPKKE